MRQTVTIFINHIIVQLGAMPHIQIAVAVFFARLFGNENLIYFFFSATLFNVHGHIQILIMFYAMLCAY